MNVRFLRWLTFNERQQQAVNIISLSIASEL